MMRVLRIIWVILLQFNAFISCVIAVASSNHDKRGYISIDCGNPSPMPIDNVTYSSDSGFIDTGIKKQVLPNDITSPSFYNTLRSFPDGDRNCYTLKPLNGKGNNFLIRAHFKYENYDGKGKFPQFLIYIGVNFWDKVTTQSMTYIEIIHKLTTDSIDICLVKIGNDTPFISALLLRPLDDSIYTSNLGSLAIVNRYNVGSYSKNNDYDLSYPDDIYDRLWGELKASDWKQLWVPVNASTQLNLSYINNDKYKIPPSFLNTSATTPDHAMTFKIPNKGNKQKIYYVYWHFLETQKLGKGELRELDILVNDKVVGKRIRPKYMEALTIVSPEITVGPESGFNFSVKQSNESTLRPFLNAVEIYYVVKLPQSPTNQDDVKAMMDIKTNYKHKINSGWQADPCLPFTPWDGLNCSNNDTNSPRIISLNLASRGLTGKILPSLSLLTSLRFLNLSNNQLTGDVPEFLVNMSSLEVIDLSGNQFNGSVPAKLIQKSNDGSLVLSLEGNSGLCNSSTCTKKNANHSKVLVPLIACASSVLVLLIALAVFCACRWNSRQGYTNKKTSVGGMKSESKQFSYSDVIRITNNFQRSIGKGAFGNVYHGHLQDGAEVAVKILNQSNIPLILQSFQTEAELLMRVHHRNLVSLVGYCDEHNTKVLIYEYMDNGDLQQQLLGERTLSWKERLQISIDAAQGLEYLHNGCKPGIVHRDIKTPNILLDDKLVGKIGDFGLSRIFATESTTHISTKVAGTPGYLDPEYHASGRLTEKSDVYSFGVILLELISGRKALERDDNMNPIYVVSWVAPYLSSGDIHNIVDKRLQGDYNINSVWKALETAIACTSKSGSERPSMNQVVNDLKESLALELSHEKQMKGGEHEPNCSDQNFDGIYIDDSLAFIGPSAR